MVDGRGPEVAGRGAAVAAVVAEERERRPGQLDQRRQQFAAVAGADRVARGVVRQQHVAAAGLVQQSIDCLLGDVASWRQVLPGVRAAPIDPPDRPYPRAVGEGLHAAVLDRADAAVGVHREGWFPAGVGRELFQSGEVFVIPGGEPQPGGGVRFLEDGIGERVDVDDVGGAEFEGVGFGVAEGGLVDPGGVGEVAEVADLQQAVEGDGVVARPRGGEAERRENLPVQVAEDEEGGHARQDRRAGRGVRLHRRGRRRQRPIPVNISSVTRPLSVSVR